MNPLTLLVAAFALTAQSPDEPEDAAVPAPIPVVVIADGGAPVDAAAEAAYAGCQERLSLGDVESARRCFTRIAVDAPESEAALKSRAALFVLDARLTPPPAAEENGNLIPPGRLGITTAAGLFGAWNAVAGGVLVGVNSRGAIPGQPLVVGTGVAAVAAGVGMGAGGYFIADHLKLDEGAARLVASSLMWGTVLGVGLSGITTLPFQGSGDGVGAINAGVLTVLASGYAAGGGALILATGVEFDEAQVGLINSGGMIGSFVGIMIMPNIPLYSSTGTSTVNAGVAYGTTYMISTTAGLLAGGALGRVLDMTWGEVLLCDLGGVLGGVGGGAIGVGINGGTAVATASPAVGVLAGYGAGIAIVSLWRESRGAPILRNAPELRPVVSSVATSRTASVPTFGLAGEF